MNDDFDFRKLIPADVLADMERDEAAGPYPCAGGCGKEVTYSKQKCDACKTAERRAQEAKEARERLEYCSRKAVPVAFQWALLDCPELPKRCGGAVNVKKVKATAEALRARTIVSAVFLGPAGSGKTSAACAVLRDAILMGADASLFVDSFALSRAYRNASLGDEPELITRACDATLAVLDDLGIEPPAGRDAVIEVIHRRHSAARRTIVTSGFDQEALRGFYGDGIVRRLFERSATISFGPAMELAK